MHPVSISVTLSNLDTKHWPPVSALIAQRIAVENPAAATQCVYKTP